MDEKRLNVEPAGFFCLRTPLLPFEHWLAWSEGLELPGFSGDPAAREAALTRDLALLRARLRETVARPEIREAIFLASPSLDEALDLWLAQPDSERGGRAQRSLVKYLTRMATRSTPFGLFATVSTGIVAAETRLQIPPREKAQRHTRLDSGYLFSLTAALGRDPAVRGALRYFPNDSLYFAAGRGRYAEARPGDNGPSYHLVSVEDTPALRDSLARASNGATPAELSAALVDGETTLAEAEEFVVELIESRVLTPELAVPVTGPEPMAALTRQLSGNPITRATGEQMQTVESSLRSIDRAGLGNAPARYREIAESLAALPGKVELSRLFQVDLVRPPAPTLGRAIVAELVRAVELLQRISPSVADSENLIRFRDAFRSRYEGREVPFLEATDEEIGVGSTIAFSDDPSPLLKGVDLPRLEDQGVLWGKRERHLARRVGECLSSGAIELALTPEDLDPLTVEDPGSLSAAFAVVTTLAAQSESELTRGHFRLRIGSVGGASGVELLGRFCHADPTLADRVARHLREVPTLEPAAVVAEIAHLPEGRTGNIILRPNLHEYEITYLGRSGAVPERQIPASDLLLSLVDDELVLRSARLGRRVVPRLTSAHAFNFGLGPYRLLCLLQTQGVAAGTTWRWGALEALPFLPRLAYGRLILALARWRVFKDEIRGWAELKGVDLVDRAEAWRVARGIPRYVNLTDSQTHLSVDLQNPLSLECLAHDILQDEETVLEELWPQPDQLIARGPEGSFQHEMVVPLVRIDISQAKRSRTAKLTGPLDRSARRFPPGSEWLYVKLYTSPALADDLLAEVVGPMTHSLLEERAIDGWFFTRYSDPDFHLRWRLHGEAESLTQHALPRIQAAIAQAMEHGATWRLQFDTYEREVERYGGPRAIELVERLFQIDSQAVLEILELLEAGDAGLEERWRLALRGTDDLLNAFGLSLNEKRDVVEKGAGYAVPGGKLTPILRRQLTARCRELRTTVETVLDHTHDGDSPLGSGFAVFKERSDQFRPIIAELRKLEQREQLGVSTRDLAGTCAHMSLNRLIRGAPNHHELVLYQLLRRFYEGQAARG